MTRQSISRSDFLRLAGLTVASLLVSCRPLPASPTVIPPTETLPPSPTTPLNEREVIVLVQGLNFPEGPAFDPQGNLWCTELLGGNLVRLENGKPVRYRVNGNPNGLAFDKKGRAWVPDSAQNQIRRFDPASEKWEVIASSVDGEPLHTPNDLSFDARGNLIFTCPNFDDNSPTGYVCCLKPDGGVVKIAEGYYRPNGLDIVEGGKVLVVADTWQKKLFKGDWDDQNSTWGNPQPWAIVGGSEGPDGMAPGADGLLYVAIYGDGVVKVVDAAGKIVKTYPVPGSNPTNVTFDPSGKLGMVLTETEKGQLLSYPNVQPGLAIFNGGDAWP